LEYFKGRRKIPLLRELCMVSKTIYIGFLQSYNQLRGDFCVELTYYLEDDLD